MLTARSTKKLFGTVATASIAVVPFALGSVILVTPRQASAEVTTYSTSNRTYKVGILLIDSTADANNDGVIDPAEAGRGAENPDPFMFQIADARLDLKPAGWTLINPLAPSTVTTDIFTRWSQVGGRDPGHPYQVGQKVTKDMAAYWEVSLTKATLEELLSFDVLFISNHRRTRFSQTDSEKLRKVVDAGGVVWMDNCGGMIIDENGKFFLGEVQFNNGQYGLNNGAGPEIQQPTHPLINSPYALSYNDIVALGDKAYGQFYLTSFGAVPNTAPNKETLTTIIGNKRATDSVLGNALPYISAGVYGSGGVIVTCADIGCGVNDYSGGFNAGSGGNSGAYAGKDLQAANAEDLKFTYNAITWGGANNTVRRNNRRVASSSSAVSAPLNPSFDFRNAPTADAIVQSNSSPLIYQGIMYVSGIDSGGQATVRAYDILPNRDYDNDGNNDDGRPDLIGGTPYDEIWRYDGPTATGNVQPSSPVLASILFGTETRSVILVTLGNGNVVMLGAKPTNTAGSLTASAFVFPSNAATATGGAVYSNAVNNVAPAPVFFGNKVYAVEPTDAIVRCINIADFSNYEWKSTNAANLGYRPTGTPTLGLNRLTVSKTSGNGGADNSLAGNTDESTNDIMMYVPVVEPNGTDAPSKLLPFWLGTRGEGNQNANFDGTKNVISFRPGGIEANNVFVSKGRLSGNPNSPFTTPDDNIKLYADVTLTIDGVDQTFTREQNFAAGRAVYPKIDRFFSDIDPAFNGNLFQVQFENSTTNADYYSGKVDITYSGDAKFARANRVLAVADYDTVYVPFSGANPTNLDSQPGHRNVAPLTIPNSTGLDTAAFAPNDLLMYSANQNVTNQPFSFGGIFALQEREYSRGASRLRWHYVLHNGYTDAPIGTDRVSDLPALRNRLTFAGSANAQISTTGPNFYEPLNNIRTVGSPITTNDGVTYVLAQASSAANNGAVTVLMAFQTTPQITLDLGVPLADGSVVTVSQYDPVTQTTVSTTGDNNDRTRIDVDYETGKVTVADFHRQDDPKQLLSASSTFVVKYSPKGAQVGDGAQPTKAFAPFGTVPDVTIDTNGNLSDGGTGSTSGGFSPLLWYYVLPGAPNGASPVKIGDQIFLTIDNNIVAVDADPVSNDPTIRVRSGEQVYNVVDTLFFGANSRTVERNHVRWAAPLPTNASAGSPSGDEGTVAVSTLGGTVAYTEGLTLLSDNSRVMEVDSNGAAVWVTTATADIKTTGGEGARYLADGTLDPNITTRGVQISKSQGFSSPRSVRRLGSSDYLVADTGNNRVVRFDKGAVVRWSVSRVSDPYGVLAPGDPLTLDTPTDVLTRRLASFDVGGTTRTGFEDHYIIADSGNGRILDVVDYYTLDGQPRTDVPGTNGQSSGIVAWTTRTKSKDGQNLAYTKLQLLASSDGVTSGKPVLVASVANTGIAASNNDKTANGGSGSLVQLDYNPFNTGFVLVDAGTGAFSGIGRYWDSIPAEPINNGRPLLAVNELRTYAGGVVNGTKPLASPSYFEEIPLDVNGDGVPEKVYLIADSDGVYVAVIKTDPATPVGNPTQSAKSYFDVLWHFRQRDYDIINGYDTVGNVATAPARLTIPGATPGNALTPRPRMPRLAASSVKRLANGNFLITNSAAESSSLFNSGRFAGEVFEVTRPTFQTTGTGVNNTVYGSSAAAFSAPRIVPGVAGAPNRQQMGRDANGATLTEQPHSADRL